MSEQQPIKPEAKHKHQPKIPMRPTTEGHIVKGIDPELERNQPKYTEEKIKLNLEAKPFRSVRQEMQLYGKTTVNNPETQNINNNNNNYYYNQNFYPNPYGNNMQNMNMNQGAPYPYQMQMPFPGYNPNFNNQRMYNNNFPPHPPQGYPQNNESYNYQKNMVHPHNNNYYKGTFNKKYSSKDSFPTSRTESSKSQTGLNINSKPFKPASKQEKAEKKEENPMSLNINATPYKPQNIELKEKENLAHSNKEEKAETLKPKKTDSRLRQLLDNPSPKKTTDKTKSNYNKESDKNINNNFKKKNSKKTEAEKRIELINKKSEKFKKEKEEEEKKRKEKEKELEEKKKEEERKRKEEEERKRKEEEERKKREEEKIIEDTYFFTFKYKKPERIEKFTFEYIMQFRKWKICTEDLLLTDEVKKHFKGFKEEIKEGLKKKKEREDNNKRKDNFTKAKPKESSEKKLPDVNSMEQWARIDLTKEIKAAEEFKQKLNEENKQDVLKKDLRNLLNLLTHDNYSKIKKDILDKIKDSTDDQEQFLDVLFQKAVLEKAFVKLYCKMIKELDKELPQKNKRKEKEGEKKKKEYSEMRSHLIDKCRTIFQLEHNEQFDQYIKEDDPLERRNKLKKFILGNVYFITELMKIKILSKKVGPDCLKNLYERYQKETDQNLRELTLEAIIVFSENFGRIIFEEKSLKAPEKEVFNKQLDDIFSKLEKIMEEPGLVGYIKYNIMNLLEKRKNNFALSKFDESLIAKTKEEVKKELENEGKITQEIINEKMEEELKDYKECLEEKVDFSWKNTSSLMEKSKNYGGTFGDILEGYFAAASGIIEQEKNPEYIKQFIDELIEFYIGDFNKRDLRELKERIIKLFETILDIYLDVPNIFDIYAYVLNQFLKNDLIKFSDLAELKKGDVTDENLSTTLKDLSKYYEEDDFKEELAALPFVEANKEKFSWAFE